MMTVNLIDENGNLIATYFDAKEACERAMARLELCLDTRQVIVRENSQNTYVYRNGRWICENPA